MIIHACSSCPDSERPLARAGGGRNATVVRVEGGPETRHILLSSGLVPGTRIRIESRQGEKIRISYRGIEASLTPSEAEAIVVRPAMCIGCGACR